MFIECLLWARVFLENTLQPEMLIDKEWIRGIKWGFPSISMRAVDGSGIVYAVRYLWQEDRLGMICLTM